MKKTVFSGMRPTGKLHLGHLVGALEGWVKLQKEYHCLFGIVDWHALMGEYEDSGRIPEYIKEMALDWLACGIDPEQSIVFIQSRVPEHLELFMFLACLTPLGWLERNPTYKEQLREIATRDLQTYAFLGYPVLQAADILLYKAQAVPIGEDQLPHIELTREIGRRFNFFYQADIFPDCEAILTKTPRLLGIDNRKMSKSYHNAINLSDSEHEIRRKVQGMFTDPRRIKLTDPGHPQECNVYNYYQVFAPGQTTREVYEWCSGAKKGCTECKLFLAEKILLHLAPIRAKRAELEAHKEKVEEILQEGAKKAKAIARQTIAEVKDAVFHKKVQALT